MRKRRLTIRAMIRPARRVRDEKGETMNDYLLLYRGGGMPETDEDRATAMKAWAVWMEGLGPALRDGGNPFAPGAAKTVGADGSVADGAAPASGYSIVSAASLDEATELAKGCPVLQGGADIQVYETIDVM
jgi:hypothetical protein